MSEELCLVLPDKPDLERDRVAEAWRRGWGEVLPLGRFWDPPPLDASRVRLYGPDTFCLVLAQRLDLTLLCPPDGALAALPREQTLREIVLLPLSDAGALPFPRFVKSAVPKLFPARIYASRSDLDEQTRGLPQDTLLLASEVVRFESEIRCFVLDGQPVSVSAYEGRADLAVASTFARQVAGESLWPETFVLDIGEIAGRGLAVIEANAAWGSGLNGCSASAICACIARATRPTARS